MFIKIKSYLHKYFRVARLKTFADAYPDLSNLSVLDIGGTVDIWDMLKKYYDLAPKQLVLLNTNSVHLSRSSDHKTVVGDARELPFPDQSFDLVFSNSVIEHVGDAIDKAKFAQESKRVGKEIYIQTPNRWFPIEPHIIAFFIHWLPRKLYKKLHFLSVMYVYRWYLIFKDGSPGCVNTDKWVEGADLLSYQQFKQLFPDSKLHIERVLGLNKSFVVSSRELN